MTIGLASDIVGVGGVLLVTVMYLLLQTGRVRPDKPMFSILNAVGSIMIIGSLTVHWNLPSVIMEGVWLSISLYGMAKSLRRSRASREA